MIKIINLFFVILLFLSVSEVKSQDWQVPENQLANENPSPYNLQNVIKGKELYLKNCKSCHGDAGKNNPLPLLPTPPDIVSVKMQTNTEGGLYYKITNGKGTMPQFETSLSVDDRWRIINYIMNFNPGNEPLLVDAPKTDAKLLGSVNETEKKVEIFAEFKDKDGTYSKLTNTAIIINVKKTFGKIKLGEVQTDNNGRAVYQIPDNTLGDSEGRIDLVVSLNDKFKVEELIIENAKVCHPNKAENLFEEAVLWGTNDRLQPWLLFSYLAAAGGAWMAILYVIFQLFKIWKLGRQKHISN